MGSCCATNHNSQSDANQTHSSQAPASTNAYVKPGNGSQWMPLAINLRKPSSPSQMDTDEITLIYDIPSQKFKTKEQIMKAHGYELIEMIAQGGFADIYKARRLSDRQIIACKVLNLSQWSVDIKMELFVMERTRHPNIIKLFEHYMVRTKKYSLVYIWMQFAPLGSLSKYIRETPDPLTEPLAQPMFAQIVAGLRHMHLKGFAHRDLKMGNILLDERLNVMISDFGLSCIAYRESRGGTVMSSTYCGTVLYMSPQVLQNRNGSRQPYNPFVADLWSLGVILYLILNKAYPFSDDNGLEIMFNNQMNSNWIFSRFAKSEPSTQLMDLLKQLLEPTCDKRISLTQLTSHPWVRDHIKDIPI